MYEKNERLFRNLHMTFNRYILCLFVSSGRDRVSAINQNDMIDRCIPIQTDENNDVYHELTPEHVLASDFDNDPYDTIHVYYNVN